MTPDDMPGVMMEFKLDPDRPHIELCDLLKLVGLCENGGEAKHRISEGEVKVDGIIDTRKRAKIKKGQSVEFSGETIRIV